MAHFIDENNSARRHVQLGFPSWILAVLCVLGSSHDLFSQADPRPLPMSTAKRCGTTSTTVSQTEKSDAIAVLRRVVAAMDPSGAYNATRAFTITGSLSDITGKDAVAAAKGTFSYKEDHSVPNGTKIRKFELNGEPHLMQITDGKISPVPTTSPTNTMPANLAFVPKAFEFPLGILVDDLLKPKISARVVKDRPNSIRGNAFAGLTHIEIVNPETSQSLLYEMEDWYLDPATFLPIFVGYELPAIGNAGTCVEAYTRYGEFTNISQAYVPTTITVHHGNNTVRTTTIQTLAYTAR